MKTYKLNNAQFGIKLTINGRKVAAALPSGMQRDYYSLRSHVLKNFGVRLSAPVLTKLYNLDKAESLVTPDWQDLTCCEYVLIGQEEFSVFDAMAPEEEAFPTGPRRVVPLWKPDTRLIHEEAEHGWEVAQQIQTLQSMFYDMIEEGKPTKNIKKRAFAMIDALKASELDAPAVEVLTSHLQGIIDACWQGERSGVAKWWPGRKGQPHAKEQAQTEGGKVGAWYHAKPGHRMNLDAFTRRNGERVETLLVYREEKRTVNLTCNPEQANRQLVLGRKASPKLQEWASAQWEKAQQ